MISNDLLAELLRFRQKRNWEQFHKPKDLAISFSVEAAELIEIFQWKTNEEVAALIATESKQRIEDEVADVAIMLLYLCHDLGIDLLMRPSKSARTTFLTSGISTGKAGDY